VDLHPDEQISPRLHSISDGLVEAGWYAEISAARYAWPYAQLWADHGTGARIFICAAWSPKRAYNGHRRFPGDKYSFWFSPPPAGESRSLWHFLRREHHLLPLAVDPFLEVPSWAPGQGFIPRQQTGCICEKTKHPDEQTAARALERAVAARAAGMTRRREQRYYQCPQDAAAFHLTSHESWVQAFGVERAEGRQ
jgi:hypothetical protein